MGFLVFFAGYGCSGQKFQDENLRFFILRDNLAHTI